MKDGSNFQKLGEWKDDLIWCPSQCYLEISKDSKTYIVYLRWRWNDPWTCDLISDTDLTGLVLDGLGEWESISLPFLSETEPIDKVHSIAEQAVSDYFMLAAPPATRENHH